MESNPNKKYLLISEKPFKRCPQKKIGVLGLNKPSSLNALDLDITSLLKDQLLHWMEDDSLLCVLIHSHCPKAFCAGGDVKQMVQALEGGDASSAFQTLAQEYFVDYLIHRYPKPIMVWAHGWILGGGWGLLSGASHRWVSSQSHLSMPELDIGFFPDVASAYFLNQLSPPHLGLFLVWTGARLTGKEAFRLGLVDGVFDAQEHPHLTGVESFLEDLQTLNVKHLKSSLELHAALQATWKPYAISPSSDLPASVLLSTLSLAPSFYAYLEGDFLGAIQHHRQLLQEKGRAEEKTESMATLWKNFSRYFERAAPLSIYMSWKHFHCCRGHSLEEVFKQDYHLASSFFKDPTFIGGVRERLFHKKEQVHWPHSCLLKKRGGESLPWDPQRTDPCSETLSFYKALDKISHRIKKKLST